MLVTSQTEADQIFQKLAQKPYVAIDTEFHWTRTYAPIPALIQVGTEDEHYLIDVTEIKDFSSLGDFLENEDCAKIIHSCSQDLILFYLMTGKVTKNLFDSQIAYAFLNDYHQISFGKMVEDITDQALSKGSQRSNWLKRPLSPTQLQYAANDVIWLMKCFPSLQEKLAKLKRNDWHRAECQNYETDAFYEVTPEHKLYRQIKGAGRLNRDQLSILRELCAWREKISQKLNLRPRVFLSPEALFSIVYNKPRNTKDLKRCRDISPNVMRFNSRDIVECVDIGLSLEEDQKPPIIEKRIPSKREEKFADSLYKMVQDKAAALQMSANLLLTKSTCKKIASWNFKELAFDFGTLASWRQDLLKEDILKIANNFS